MVLTGNASDILQMSTTIEYHVLYREIKRCLPFKFGEKKQQLISLMLFTFTIACWVILYAFLSSADFFQNQLFLKIVSGIPSECQTNWIRA